MQCLHSYAVYMFERLYTSNPMYLASTYAPLSIVQCSGDTRRHIFCMLEQRRVGYLLVCATPAPYRAYNARA